MSHRFQPSSAPMLALAGAERSPLGEDPGDIVDETYAVTVDPLRYEQLLTTWQRYVEPRTAMLQSRFGKASAADPALEEHCNRALQIFERIGRRRQTEQTAEMLVAGLPVFAAIVDGRGRMIAANEPARALGAMDGERAVARLSLDDQTLVRLDAWLMGRPAEGEPPLLLPCRIGEDERPSCIIGKRVRLFDPSLDCGPGREGGFYLLTTIDIRCDADLMATIASAFALTRAEAEIALALASGRTPASIAQARAASLETVRTQIKSIQRKLDVRTTPEVVTIVNGFSVSYALNRTAGDQSALAAPEGGYHRSDRILQDDGRVLAFEESGAGKGRPVLFVHDMMHGKQPLNTAVFFSDRADSVRP